MSINDCSSDECSSDHALARALKTSDFNNPADMPERIEAAFRQAVLDRLGLEARASMVVTGSEKIETAARRGQVKMLLHAADAAPDGCHKLNQAWRVGMEQEGTDLTGTVLPVARGSLSMAMGRDNVGNIAINDKKAENRKSSSVG